MRILANCIAILHLYWIKAILGGLVVSYFVAWYRPYQVAIVALTITSWPICGGCPLTIWENRLRRKFDPDSAYQEGYVTHYAKKCLGLNVPSKFVTVGNSIVLIFSIVIFLGLLD